MENPSKVELWLSFDNVSKLALSIPLAECGRHAVHPLKWLRFLAYAIYGQEGYLSVSKDGPEIDDYNEDVQGRPYYFVSPDEPRLVDINAVDDRTSDASELSNQRADFRESLINRDGTCVITGDHAWNCIACHIIPHFKGDNYISKLVLHRGGTDTHVDDLDGIDDSCNGLLLLGHIHRPFGAGEVAFLKTPNFSLTVDDIPYNQPRAVGEQSPAARLTLQYFASEDRLGPTMNLVAPRNSDARLPEDTSEWPPAIIIDLFYACAALRAWGPKPFSDFARKRSMDIYYDTGDDDMGDDDNDVPVGGPGHADVHLGDQGTERSRRYEARNERKMRTARSMDQSKDSFLSLMDGVLALWMRSSKERKRKAQRQSDGVLDPTCKHDDIKKWLKSTQESIL